MNTIKRAIFIAISLHVVVCSIFAMDNNNKLCTKKPYIVAQEQEKRKQRISKLVSALLNKDCSDDELASKLLLKGYTPEEIRNAKTTLKTSQEGAYLTFDEVKAAISDYNPMAKCCNEEIQANVWKTLTTALKKILKEQELGSLSTRVQHPTDEMVIEWFQRYLHTPQLSEQSLKVVNDRCHDENFVKSLWLLQTRDLGRYVFYKAQARLNEMDDSIPTIKAPSKKRKFESINNNNNQIHHTNTLTKKTAHALKEENLPQSIEKNICRFDGCNITASSKYNLKVHYLSSNHRACPYNNCDKNTTTFKNTTDLKKHLDSVHQKKKSKEIYFCETCNFVGIIGSHSKRHEDSKKHRELN